MLLSVIHATNGMVITEVMYNPAGDENANEFIELFNESSNRISLSGWHVSDGEDTDSLVALDQGFHVESHQYVIIMDPDYFADSSTTYDGMIPENALVLTIDNSTFGSRGLSNSTAEPVSLVNQAGAVVSSYTYHLGNIDGYSDEKIFPAGPNDASNWANSIVLNGTPGARNSVTPPDSDYAITKFYSVPTTPLPGDTFVLSMLVKNLGQLSVCGHIEFVQTSSD